MQEIKLYSADLNSSVLNELTSGWQVIEAYRFNFEINGILSSNSMDLAIFIKNITVSYQIALKQLLHTNIFDCQIANFKKYTDQENEQQGKLNSMII